MLQNSIKKTEKKSIEHVSKGYLTTSLENSLWRINLKIPIDFFSSRSYTCSKKILNLTKSWFFHSHALLKLQNWKPRFRFNQKERKAIDLIMMKLNICMKRISLKIISSKIVYSLLILLNNSTKISKSQKQKNSLIISIL